MIGTKINTFQLDLKNRFAVLQELGDIETLNKNMAEMIKQNATSIAKQTKKHKKSRISAPTRALMKRGEKMANTTQRSHTICGDH